MREITDKGYDKRQIGFIAQEVKAANEKLSLENNIVHVDEDGFHRMDYGKLIVPVVRATQELNEELKKRDEIIAGQQKQIDELRAMMKSLLETEKAEAAASQE